MLVLSGAWNVSRGKGGRFWEVSRTKEDPPGSGPRIRIVMLPETEVEEGKVAVPFELALFAHVPDVGDFGELGWFEGEDGGCGGGCHGVDLAGADGVSGGYLDLEDTPLRRSLQHVFFLCKTKKRHGQERRDIYPT